MTPSTAQDKNQTQPTRDQASLQKATPPASPSGGPWGEHCGSQREARGLGRRWGVVAPHDSRRNLAV